MISAQTVVIWDMSVQLWKFTGLNWVKCYGFPVKQANTTSDTLSTWFRKKSSLCSFHQIRIVCFVIENQNVWSWASKPMQSLILFVNPSATPFLRFSLSLSCSIYFHFSVWQIRVFVCHCILLTWIWPLCPRTYKYIRLNDEICANVCIAYCYCCFPLPLPLPLRLPLLLLL